MDSSTPTRPSSAYLQQDSRRATNDSFASFYSEDANAARHATLDWNLLTQQASNDLPAAPQAPATVINHPLSARNSSEDMNLFEGLALAPKPKFYLHSNQSSVSTSSSYLSPPSPPSSRTPSQSIYDFNMSSRAKTMDPSNFYMTESWSSTASLTRLLPAYEARPFDPRLASSEDLIAHMQKNGTLTEDAHVMAPGIAILVRGIVNTDVQRGNRHHRGRQARRCANIQRLETQTLQAFADHWRRRPSDQLVLLLQASRIHSRCSSRGAKDLLFRLDLLGCRSHSRCQHVDPRMFWTSTISRS